VPYILTLVFAGVPMFMMEVRLSAYKVQILYVYLFIFFLLIYKLV
jgi:hypothetical protein